METTKRSTGFMVGVTASGLVCLALVGGVLAQGFFFDDEAARSPAPDPPPRAAEPEQHEPETREENEVGRPGGPVDAPGTIGLDRFAEDAEEHGFGSSGGSVGGGLRGRVTDLRVRLFTPEVRGDLSREAVRRVVHRHLGEVRTCYGEALTLNPELEGRLVVRFEILPTGAVGSTGSDESTLNDRRVEDCIAAKVRRWSFPAPEGGGRVTVSYPILLSSSG